MSDTKEKILQTSLYLFALDGYEAVSVSNIADEVDISKGALYKHFEKKRDIFNSIIERMKELKEQKLISFKLPEKNPSETLEEYRKRSFFQIKDQAINIFEFWTEHPFARDFRRMIMLEQFRNPEMNDLYQKYLVTGPMTELENGFRILQKGNPEKLASKFYSQMFLLISISDSAESLQNTESILQEHLEEFGERYFFISPMKEISNKKEKPLEHKGLLQRAQEIQG